MSNGSTIQITTKLWFTPFYQQRMYHLPTEATGRRLRPMLKNINPFLAKKAPFLQKKCKIEGWTECLLRFSRTKSWDCEYF